MRISAGSINTLASNWLLFVARAGVALLLALAIATADSLDEATFAGALGMFAVTDGALSTIIWLRARRLRLAGLMGLIGIVSGLAAMVLADDARYLLLAVALRALAIGIVKAAYARAMLHESSARWLLVAGAVSALSGLAFLGVLAFGYDALDLRYCIAGQLGIAGSLLLVYSLKQRAQHTQQARAFEQPRPTH